MILVDANLLVYAAREDAAQHPRARRWLAEALGGTARVALPWESLVAFVRLVTNRRIFERPSSLPDAWEVVERGLARPGGWVPAPSDEHAGILAGLLQIPGLRSADVPDAHLAALALGHGLTLCSADAGFARFGTLRWENPLASP